MNPKARGCSGRVQRGVLLRAWGFINFVDSMVHAYNCFRLYNYYLQYSLTICHLYDSLCDSPDKIYWSTRRKYKHHSNHMRKILKHRCVCLTSNVWYWLVKTIWLLATIVLQWNMSGFDDFKMPPCSFISMTKQISSHTYQTNSNNNL